LFLRYPQVNLLYLRESTVMLSKNTIQNLNRDCYCFPIDRDSIDRGIHQSVPEVIAFDGARENLFAGTGILLDQSDTEAMLGVVDAVEALADSSSFREHKIAQNPALSDWQDLTSDGMIMGYDFHIGADGPQLIEVNTNAGGAFIANELHIVSNQSYPPCCGFGSLEMKRDLLFSLLQHEWRSAGRGELKVNEITAAIVDDNPQEQYLYPDMQIAKNYFEKSGIKTIIADIASLKFENGVLHNNGTAIDIVYNRSTDFMLQEDSSVALKSAALAGAAVVAPNPLHHALYANKINFIDYTDAAKLDAYGLSKTHCEYLMAHVPDTMLLTTDNAAELYARRKKLFFKPVDGFGSRAVYRGDKITSRVWEQMLADLELGRQYIAQVIVPPSLRAVETQGDRSRLKFDVRIYTAGGEPIIAAARIYQGQTTNFRTVGGGFGPVYMWDNEGVPGNDCSQIAYGRSAIG